MWVRLYHPLIALSPLTEPSPTMNKLSAGGVFLLCLFLGIIFDQVAFGIISGLILGAGAGKVTAPKREPEG
jgi:hypothetical protein